MAKAQDDLLVLCARAGRQLFDDYLIRDGDITVVWPGLPWEADEP
jgi:hypothetical protein